VLGGAPGSLKLRLGTISAKPPGERSGEEPS
jgi:hypothetical protein